MILSSRLCSISGRVQSRLVSQRAVSFMGIKIADFLTGQALAIMVAISAFIVGHHMSPQIAITTVYQLLQLRHWVPPYEEDPRPIVMIKCSNLNGWFPVLLLMPSVNDILLPGVIRIRNRYVQSLRIRSWLDYRECLIINHRDEELYFGNLQNSTWENFDTTLFPTIPNIIFRCSSCLLVLGIDQNIVNRHYEFVPDQKLELPTGDELGARATGAAIALPFPWFLFFHGGYVVPEVAVSPRTQSNNEWHCCRPAPTVLGQVAKAFAVKCILVYKDRNMKLK
ncbi:hypothetical protein Tco_1184110 [Tanacetum coccineum]